MSSNVIAAVGVALAVAALVVGIKWKVSAGIVLLVVNLVFLVLVRKRSS